MPQSPKEKSNVPPLKTDASTSDNALYDPVYSDQFEFVEKLHRDDPRFETPGGQRLLDLLRNSPRHLNTRFYRRPEGVLPPFELLAETSDGRALIRKELKITPDGYFFGKTQISNESLKREIKGVLISEWLNMSDYTDKICDQEISERQRIEEDAKKSYQRFDQAFFSIRHVAPLIKTGSREQSDQLNSILQEVVFGKKREVLEKLKSLEKHNPSSLITLLSCTGTAEDYSGRKITGLTLFQASIATGDIEMANMIQEFIKRWLGEAEITAQLIEIFENGIEEHHRKQESNIFNFEPIYNAIKNASEEDIDNLDKEGTPLFIALEKFRQEFTKMSYDEKIFNLNHLLKAFQLNDKGFGSERRDDIFLVKVVGFCQRFIPAYYAFYFTQGLYYLVPSAGEHTKKYPTHRGEPWREEGLSRTLEFRPHLNKKLKGGVWYERLEPSGLFYYPLDTKPGYRLGYDRVKIGELSDPDHTYHGRPSEGPKHCVAEYLQKLISDHKQALLDRYSRKCQQSANYIFSPT